MRVPYTYALASVVTNLLIFTIISILTLTTVHFMQLDISIGPGKYLLAIPIITVTGLTIIYKILVEIIHIGTKKEEEINLRN